MKAIFTGDWHYGLTVEELDRTPEIQKAVDFAITTAIEQRVDLFSIGGDLIDTNSPHYEVLKLLIRSLNRLEDAGIKTTVLLGNHDAVSAPDRYWGLTPLEEVGYTHVEFITRPTLKELCGNSFLFLPHITKNRLQGTKYKSVQEYLELYVDRVLQNSSNLTVVSHYNLNGAKVGTETMTVKQHDLKLPHSLLSSNQVLSIFNSHIHTPSTYWKAHMPGSLICTDFGDTAANKGFILGTLDKTWEVERILTPQSPLQEFEINITLSSNYSKDLMDKVDAISTEILDDAIVKLRIILPEDKLHVVDSDLIKSKFNNARFVKDIQKMITRKRQIRDKEQRSTLTAKEAVDLYITKRKPNRLDEKIKLAHRIIDAGINADPRDTESVFHSQEIADTELETNLDALDMSIPNLGDDF